MYWNVYRMRTDPGFFFGKAEGEQGCISFPSKNGDIFGSITYETDEGERKYDFGLLEDIDEYGKNSIKNQNARAVIIELANAVVAVF